MSHRPQEINPALTGLPELELYEIYQDTVRERFKNFGCRTANEAYQSLATPLEIHIPNQPIDQWLIDSIVTPDSFNNYVGDLGNYINDNGVDDHLEHRGSIAIVTNHAEFTDDPITAEAVARLGLVERENILQVVSKMIAVLTLDTGTEPIIVMDKLRQISNVLKTFPRIDGRPTKPLVEFRKRSNEQAVNIMTNFLSNKGNILVESFIGRHDKPSKSKNTLYIHEPNRRTAGLLQLPGVLTLPIYIHCPTFAGDWTPADMQYEFFPPVMIEDPAKDSKRITNQFRQATERTAGSRYRHGVKVRSWAAQQAVRRGKRVLRPLLTTDSTEMTEY